MRSLAVLLLVFGLICPVLAQPAPAQDALADADQAAIRSAITQQLNAFQRDDAAGAFAFAAPNIKAIFGNADNFLAMVRQGYPPVYRPRRAEFTTLSQEDGAIVQTVELIGPDGLSYTARYTMEQQADGSWRISACELVESRRLGV